MKLRKMMAILLALCTVLFLAGCDGGGGSDDDNDGGNDSDSGTDTYKVIDLVDTTGVTDFSTIDGGIQYTYSGQVHKDYVTLTLDEEAGTFSLYEKEVLDETIMADCTFSGTFTVSGSTINVHCTLTKYTNGDPDSTAPWDDTFTIIDDDTIHVWGWIMKD